MPPIQNIERIKLPIASPFYVTEEMTDLLIHAAASFPETEFRPMDLPLEAGFVYFTKAIPTLDIHLKNVPWRAFSWGTTHDGATIPAPWGVHLAFYDHRDERVNSDYAPDEGNIGLLDILPTLGLNHETTWAFGSSHRADQTGGTIFNKDMLIPEDALLSGAGADPSARGERRHQCRASDGGFVRGFSLDLDGASLSATLSACLRFRLHLDRYATILFHVHTFAVADGNAFRFEQSPLKTCVRLSNQ